MKLRSQAPGALLLVLLCVLPARSAETTPTELHTFTPIDSTPTKDDIVKVTGPDSIVRLHDLATDPLVDFGVQIRAIRALPQFCSPSCTPSPDLHPAHVAVLDVMTKVMNELTMGRNGRTLLRLRATIESLGAVKSGLDSDVDLIVPFLADANRDIRATTATALRAMCNQRAVVPLRARLQAEMVKQVQLAISAALRDLGQCTPS